MQSKVYELLEEVFTEFDLGVNYQSKSELEKLALAREYALALFQEVAELTDSFQFASWKKPITDRQNIKREVVDCLFFLHHICRCFEIMPIELVEMGKWVIENNKRRYYDNGNRETQLLGSVGAQAE